MKYYLKFSIIGDIEECKTKETTINYNNDNYLYHKIIKYNEYNFIVFYNDDQNKPKNISYLPFYDNTIYGDFLLFMVDDNNNLLNLSEKKFLKYTSKKIQNSSSLNYIVDYSSDDFNLSD